MKYYKDGFFTRPVEGAAPITDETWAELLAAQSQGCEIIADAAGYPIARTKTETLAEAKERQIETIKNARDAAEKSGFSYLGKVFDSDPVSVQRLTCAAQTAMLMKQSGQPFAVAWTTKDNSIINLDADQMIGAIPALTIYSGQLHQTAAGLKAAVMAAETIAEVEAVAWG